MIVNVGDVQLGVDDDGSGLPVVFLHGFPHDRSLWAQQRRALSSHVRCITPDLRGFGESTFAGPVSMDVYADDIAALLDVLDIDKAVVCGLSMGGYVAMAMWRRHAARVHGLVLCDTKSSADTAEGRGKRDELIALALSDGATAVAEKQIGGMVGKSTRERQPDVVEFMRAMMMRQSVPGIVGALEALRERPNSHDTIGSITVPTLVLVGEEDVLTPVGDAQAMFAALSPHATPVFEIVSASGHATCVERPAAVTHAIADFLATLDVERS